MSFVNKSCLTLSKQQLKHSLCTQFQYYPHKQFDHFPSQKTPISSLSLSRPLPTNYMCDSSADVFVCLFLGGHIRQCSEDKMECCGLKLGQLQPRQAPYHSNFFVPSHCIIRTFDALCKLLISTEFMKTLTLPTSPAEEISSTSALSFHPVTTYALFPSQVNTFYQNE